MSTGTMRGAPWCHLSDAPTELAPKDEVRSFGQGLGCMERDGEVE